MAANNPTTPKSQTQATTVLSEAKKSSTPIPPTVVEQAGLSFVNVSKDDPNAWRTALEFLNYRSILNVSFLAGQKWIALTDPDLDLVIRKVLLGQKLFYNGKLVPE